MKTTKIFLVIALFSFAFVGYPQTECKKKHLSAKISLNCALQNFGLVMAMYNQLDKSFLLNESNGNYTVKVCYNQIDYLITGSLKEWILFFMRDIYDYSERRKEPSGL